MRHPNLIYRNQLLRALERDDLEALEPHFELVDFGSGNVFEESDRLIPHVLFPEGGLLSLVCRSQTGRTIDAGLIGFDGMTGLAVVMGDTRSLLETHVRVSGTGHRIAAHALAGLLEQRRGMMRIFLRYAHVFNEQVAQTVMATGESRIDVRLARWLLMAADRVGSAGMPLTHELLASALSVRRPGVTDALHRLKGDLTIRAQRGSLTITNREALEAMAGGSYGSLEREYRRNFRSVGSAEDKLSKSSTSDGSTKTI